MKSVHLQLVRIIASICISITYLALESYAQDQGVVSPAGSHQSVGGAPQMHQDAEVQQTSWPSLPLPKITLPKVTMPKVTMPDMSTITKPVKTSFGKITSGTKKAWEGTKELFTFGGQTSNTAPAESQDGFWKRMFSSEPEPPSGPQTVGEWMAQPRIDP